MGDFVNNQSIYTEYEQKESAPEEILTTPIISIIVPAYNVEKYISKCLDSITNQTFKEIEIIIIDDGSTDKTREIITKYAEKDKRIIFLSQENSGPSAARNKGLEIARGEYISFVDSDDWIDRDYVEKLYQTIKKYSCDVAVTTVQREHAHRNVRNLNFENEQVFSTLQDKIQICNIPKCCYVCGKLFKKDLIKNAKFANGKFFEDILWLPRIIKKANSLVTVGNICYHYVVNPNSIVKKTSSSQKQIDLYNARKYIIKFFNDNNLNLPAKYQNITKRIVRFLGLPIFKIKENNFVNTLYLFGFLPIFKYRDFDSHYIFKLFGIRISVKHKSHFDYKKATEFGVTFEKRSPQLIVSLTSHPPRIETAAISINTLLRQTVKPDRIILWLADSQFPNKEEDLPDGLLKLRELGVEIKWCEDLLSYKKIVPALQMFPEDIIVTADDDLYYEEDWLESLYNAYLENSKNIYTRRAVKMKIANNNITSYNRDAQLGMNFDIPSFYNQPMTGSGCIFPPHVLHEDIFDKANFMSLIPTHDDIYVWFMAILKGTKVGVVRGYKSEMITIDNTDNSSLCKINNNKGRGLEPDEAFKRMTKRYPNVYNILTEATKKIIER